MRTFSNYITKILYGHIKFHKFTQNQSRTNRLGLVLMISSKVCMSITMFRPRMPTSCRTRAPSSSWAPVNPHTTRMLSSNLLK